MDIQWHHSPIHLFEPGYTYMVTAGTLGKRPLFYDVTRLSLLEEVLLRVLFECGWMVAAWAVFVNHYHWIAQCLKEGVELSTLIRRLHSQSARELNRLDGMEGRQVWFQFRDNRLTYERSYYARLNYVHNNPVRHGIVPVAEQYPYCSARWFRLKADPSFQRKVSSVKWDRVNVEDDY